MSLRWRLQALLAAAVLPLAGLLLVDAWQHWGARVAEAERVATAEAQAIAGRLDATLAGARQATVALALRAQDEALDVAACGEYLAAVVAAEPRYHSAALVTPRGRVWCASHTGPSSLPQIHESSLVAALNTPGVPVLGEVSPDPVRGTPSLPLALGVRDRAGRVLGAAIVSLDLAHLATALAGQFPADRGFALVADRQGTIAARIPDHLDSVARTVPGPITQAFTAETDAIVPRLEHDGRTYIAVLQPATVPSRQLSVIVGLERSAMLGPARAALIRDVTLAVAIAALALFAGWLAGHRLIERPVRELVTTAQRRVRGDVGARLAAASGTGMGEFGDLARAFDALGGELEHTVSQKTQLVREVQHRMMNSLHLLGAIFHLHSRQVDSEVTRRHLDAARQRIASISVVYRHLYESDATRSVEFGGVLRGFCDEIALACTSEPPPIEVDVDAVDLPVETAMALALIVHELVSNAIKHGYGGNPGPLRVELRHTQDKVVLGVADWGKGLPAGFVAERARTLGMVVVRSLARQLRGQLSFESRSRGTRVAVEVPVTGAAGTKAADRPSLVA